MEANTCQSPTHAERSRWGQSVGTSQTLSRMRPHHGLVQPVHPLVAALEPTRTAKIGVHDDARDVVGSERAWMPLDGDVPEALRREPWLEHVTLEPGGRDHVHLSERQRLGEERKVHVEVTRRQVAGLVQVLAMAQGRRGSFGPQIGQPRPSR